MQVLVYRYVKFVQAKYRKVSDESTGKMNIFSYNEACSDNVLLFSVIFANDGGNHSLLYLEKDILVWNIRLFCKKVKTYVLIHHSSPRAVAEGVLVSKTIHPIAYSPYIALPTC